jgi:hypothetical protein
MDNSLFRGIVAGKSNVGTSVGVLGRPPLIKATSFHA